MTEQEELEQEYEEQEYEQHENDDTILDDEAKLTKQININIIKESFSFDEKDDGKTFMGKEYVNVDFENTVKQRPEIKIGNLEESAIFLVKNSKKQDISISVNISIELPDLDLISMLSKSTGVSKDVLIEKAMVEDAVLIKIKEILVLEITKKMS